MLYGIIIKTVKIGSAIKDAAVGTARRLKSFFDSGNVPDFDPLDDAQKQSGDQHHCHANLEQAYRDAINGDCKPAIQAVRQYLKEYYDFRAPRSCWLFLSVCAIAKQNSGPAFQELTAMASDKNRWRAPPFNDEDVAQLNRLILGS